MFKLFKKDVILYIIYEHIKYVLSIRICFFIQHCATKIYGSFCTVTHFNCCIVSYNVIIFDLSIFLSVEVFQFFAITTLGK